MTRVLSIGTTHPRNTAGTGRDVVVGTELGCDVVTAIAAVSVQDDRALRSLHVLPSSLVRAQIEAALAMRPDAVRVGALACAPNVAIASEVIAAVEAPAVVDPVGRTSTGEPLIDEEGWRALCDRLATLPTVVLTPNLDEAAAMLGRARIGRGEMEEAASALRERGAAAVLLKGGHLTGDPVDVLATHDGVESFHHARIAATMRGTGCTLAMAIACGLARGARIREAVVAAREYLHAKMTAAALRE